MSNIAAQLVAGSQAIDRMRQEINTVIGIVLGGLDWEVYRHIEIPHDFPVKTFHESKCWTCQLKRYPGLTKGDQVECFYFEPRSSTRVLFWRETPVAIIPSAYVQNIYNELNIFVEIMLHQLPPLKKHLDIFINAPR